MPSLSSPSKRTKLNLQEIKPAQLSATWHSIIQLLGVHPGTCSWVCEQLQLTVSTAQEATSWMALGLIEKGPCCQSVPDISPLGQRGSGGNKADTSYSPQTTVSGDVDRCTHHILWLWSSHVLWQEDNISIYFQWKHLHIFSSASQIIPLVKLKEVPAVCSPDCPGPQGVSCYACFCATCKLLRVPPPHQPSH